ncbi:MAG: 7-carboxy-7-deazaguanine synthase QueE [Bacteroidales bacterium]|jgi:organic radical activating enzyme|nr:7-carboxy-7-deazaguanine synthase QueE [Bacteroidales bacterium]
MAKRSIHSPDINKLPLVEEFFSVQGEGFHSGKAAYFIRLGGCDVGCSWCDSRFAWDPELHSMVDTDIIIEHAVNSGTDSVVVTGGEPLMWNLDGLCKGLKKNKIRTFIETSGAYPLSGKWDWICLSPKKNMPPAGNIIIEADELKVIIEEKSDLEWAEKFRRIVSERCVLFLQPEWSRFDEIIPEIVKYVQKNPEWRISLQVHKYMHIP